MAHEGSGNDDGRRIPDQLPARRWSSCRYRHRPREDRGCRRRHGPRALRHADIWSAAACHSGDMELCYLPDMPTVLRTLAGAGNAIERWWQQLEAAQKHPEGSFKAINALAMAASYDPDPTQFLGIRLPVTFDTCGVIEERWVNWLRQDPVVAKTGGRGGVDRGGFQRRPLFLVPAGDPGTAIAARRVDHRAHRMRQRWQRAQQHAHHAGLSPNPAADVEHAVPRRAPPLPVDPISPITGVARKNPRSIGACRAGLSHDQSSDLPVTLGWRVRLPRGYPSRVGR